jgi:DNA polymerase III epsilon subunit-like protein
MVIAMQYIALDVETAGSKLGRHPAISVGLV